MDCQAISVFTLRSNILGGRLLYARKSNMKRCRLHSVVNRPQLLPKFRSNIIFRAIRCCLKPLCLTDWLFEPRGAEHFLFIVVFNTEDDTTGFSPPQAAPFQRRQ